MRPPYGTHGFYEYHLARRVGRDFFGSWVSEPRPPTEPPLDAEWGGDPRIVPALTADVSTVVVLCFERRLPEASFGDTGQYLRLPAESEGGEEWSELEAAAKSLPLSRLEVFQLVCPQVRAPWQCRLSRRHSGIDDISHLMIKPAPKPRV